MKTLIDRDMTNALYDLAESILKTHFFFEKESIDIFARGFTHIVNGEYTTLCCFASDDFKEFIWSNEDAKAKFSANFLGFHLMQTLAKILHFNDQELVLFEDLILKYLKEVEPVEHAQKHERAND